MATLSIAFNGTTRKTVTFDATEQAKMIAWWRATHPTTGPDTRTDLQCLDEWCLHTFRTMWKEVFGRERGLASKTASDAVPAPIFTES